MRGHYIFAIVTPTAKLTLTSVKLAEFRQGSGSVIHVFEGTL
jgi:hypothetical protein